MNKKLQVFVSSTYTDLIEERQAAVEAILDAGHIPAGMELFKAGNESQLKTIYKWIDESDVYMLILGGRYGSIDSKTGKSYTHLEYEYALSKNIPVFAVVLSQSFLTSKINKLGLNSVIEINNNNSYQKFKKLVMSKIIKEVNDCKDIKLAVYPTLNEFVNEYDLKGWVRNYGNNNIDGNDNNLLSQQYLQKYDVYDFISSFPTIFRKLLEKNGMSVYQFSKTAGIDRAVISKIICDERFPNEMILKKIIDILKLSEFEKSCLLISFTIYKSKNFRNTRLSNENG